MLRAALLCSLLIAGANAAGSYIITAPQYIQPGSDVEVSVDILNATGVLVRASLREETYLNGQTQVNIIANASGTFSSGSPGTLTLAIEADLVVTGSLRWNFRGTGGLQFERSEFVSLKPDIAVILIQTDKAIYKPEQLVRFRIFAVFSDLLLYTGAFSYEIIDPNGNKIRVENNVTSETSVVQGSLQLSQEPLFGTWRFDVSLLDVKARASQTFEVSLYEVPKFEVTVETQPYALIKDELLTGKVIAQYTFGQPVKGFVEIHVGPNQGADICGVLPRSTQIGLEIDGEASFTIPREDINRVVSLYNSREVKITAFVKEEATGVRLNGSTVITFYENEFQVKFTDNTPSVFKAGLAYTAFIQVTTPDNKPPVNRNITVSVYTTVNYQLTFPDQSLYSVNEFSGSYGLPGQNLTVPPSGLLTVNIEIPTNATSITIKASVGTVQVTKTVEKMFSPSNNYMQLSLLNKNIRSGTTVTIKVDATEPVNTLFYKVLSRGTVVVSGVVDGNGQTSFTFELQVTSLFAPNSHLLAYFTRGTDEVIADSLAFKVEGIFKNNVTVSFNKNQTEPNKEIVLQTTATPGSLVYALVVDKSVQLLKTGNDITPERVNTEISKFDDGQKPSDPEFPLASGATTVQDVFSTNGLLFVTDVPTPYPPSRFEPISIFRPSRPQFAMAKESLLAEDSFLARGGAPSVSDIELQTVERVRQNFPETWFFDDTVTGENGSANFIAIVPDTITSWIASVYATHPTDGLGVAPETASLTVFQAFFVSYNLPNTIIRGEQFVLAAVVSNYLSVDLTVVVTLKGSNKFQSVKPSRNGLEVLESGDQVVQIKVKSQEQGVANFPILFSTIGVADIEISAQSTSAADAVRRQIVVKPEGAPVSFNYPIFISLNGQSTFNDTIEIPLPASVVNGSDRARIKATGDPIGSSLESLASLVELPTGCGEQSVSRTAPDVWIAKYLQATDQFVGVRRTELLAFLEAGYQRQMAYQRNDASFSAFGNSDESGSTWLTAYVVKVFVQVRRFIFVDSAFLIRAVDWLIDRQNRDGSFNEFGRVLDSSIQGSGTGPVLTAFVTVALINAQPLATIDCPENIECPRVSRWGNATTNAITNLESFVDSNSLNDTLTLALVSYALKLANSSKADIVFARLQTLARREGGLLFWADNSTVTPGQTSEFFFWRPPRVQARPVDIIITSYAILTFLARNEVQEAFPAVQWLTTQRNPSGGFPSTQDTSLALEALAAYATKTADADTNINIRVSNGATLAEFNITKQNRLQLQIRELSRAPSKADVEAKGNGFAFLEIAILFNTNKALTTPSFDVSTVLIDDNLDSFNLLICTKWLWSRDSGMVIQVISIPSGFAPELGSLGNIAGLKKSERKGSTVNVYFDRIGTTSVCYSIRMTRTDKVVRTQENFVNTYAYYNPDDQATVFWQPKRLRESTACDVCPTCCP